MADDATISLTATILPDEISKTISGSMTVTPDDANDKYSDGDEFESFGDDILDFSESNPFGTY